MIHSSVPADLKDTLVALGQDELKSIIREVSELRSAHRFSNPVPEMNPNATVAPSIAQLLAPMDSVEYLDLLHDVAAARTARDIMAAFQQNSIEIILPADQSPHQG